MKQTLILVISTIAFTCTSTVLFAQSDSAKKDITRQYFIIADSLAYMEEIVANKQKYINQSLLVLLNDLKIPVKSYSLHGGSNNQSRSIWIYFNSFYNTKEAR